MPAGSVGVDEDSLVVVVTDPDWAEPLTRWSTHEAARRRAGHLVEVEVVRDVQPTSESILAQVADRPGATLVTGPLPTHTLAALLLPPGVEETGVEEPGVQAPGVGRPSGRRPVIVVPPSCWSTRPPETEESTITVGFHGSEPAGAALAWAIDESERRGGLVRAVLVWYEGQYGAIGGSVPIDVGLYPFAGPAAQRLASGAVDRTGLRVGPVSRVARRGTPTGTLIREARGSDLLVVSSGKSTVHRRRVLGAVAIGCITRSPVPVVVVPT